MEQTGTSLTLARTPVYRQQIQGAAVITRLGRRLLGGVRKIKILCIVPWCFFTMSYTHARAEDMPPRIEVGLHLTAINEEGLGEKPLGGGGGITYRLSHYLAVDTEANRYPIGGGAANFPVTQALFGARAGIQLGKIGFFGKIRPGFGVYDTSVYQPGIY